MIRRHVVLWGCAGGLALIALVVLVRVALQGEVAPTSAASAPVEPQYVAIDPQVTQQGPPPDRSAQEVAPAPEGRTESEAPKQVAAWALRLKASAENNLYHEQYKACRARNSNDPCFKELGLAQWVGYTDMRRELGDVLSHFSKFYPAGSEHVRSQLEGIATESEDAFERITALLILGHDDSMERRPLPIEAYRRMRERTPVEGAIVLSTHMAVPVDDPEALAIVQHIAEDPTSDLGLRDAAIKALGHPESAETLMAAVGTPDPELSMDTAAQALSRCGFNCLPVVERWAKEGDHTQRVYAYQIASHFGNDQERDRARVALAQSRVIVGDESAEELELIEDYLRRE